MRDTVHFDHYWSLCSWFWKNMIQNFHYMGFAQRDCLQEDKLQYRISGIYVLCFFSSVKSKIFVSSIILALGFNLFQLKPIGIFINNCHWNKFLLINLESNCFAVVCVINIAVLYIYIIYIIIWCVLLILLCYISTLYTSSYSVLYILFSHRLFLEFPVCFSFVPQFLLAMLLYCLTVLRSFNC